ncbi:outer-membrane receptor for ferric coprogen and ferric-rhodotorulic acid [Sphingomonas guangdongensis]|uniref:Outer-membrane receptor for ferric coprogen and ferric-rhodotorulic acid n=1 Tax=Sphingomonas guangdongensis TaxID=1141890 RepID=A0A285QEA8_9SPHN|nr:TonB-dependent siderophore receptor [Sphingomonas guangdongensis]SOB79814.1 outer-membrane receptor for ferric coprogen and ferric-rhodotorulic acid [Sphingomonas guangdongensis]
MLMIMTAAAALTAATLPDEKPADVPVTTATVAPVDPQAQDIIVTGAQTDGDEDYTIDGQTTATRLALSLRETPQSVSVVTRAQIDDFQLNDVNQLLTSVPGVNVIFSDTDRVYYSARGFDIQTFQIDGIGVPFAFGIQTGSIDTAIYDHIEVVRGAPGLLSSTGNPSAVINFIRKRPTREFRASANAQYGSFESLRLDADVSVPLTSDGSIRARAVGVYFDTDSHLDRGALRRWTGYGIVEADLGPETVLSGGYGHQDHRSRGALWGALPLLYADGTRIAYDRSASTAPEWSSWGVIDRQIFGDLTHKFSNGWVARVSAIRRATDENNELFYVYQNPDRTTGNGLIDYPGKFAAPTRNLTVEAYLTGPFALFGRTHELMVGVNRSAQEYQQYAAYGAIGTPVRLEDLLAGRAVRPNFPAFSEDPALDRHTRRETAYGLLRFNLAEPLKLMVGGNVTHSKSEGVSYGVPVNFDSTRFLPFVGAVADLTANLSAYASYATIFNPQTEVNAANEVLSPITGNNLEAGIKGAWFGGRLNASAAVFRTRQNNTAAYAGFANGISFYNGVDAKSEGIELDVGGQLAPGLQLTGGYTLMRVDGEDGDPVRTFVPRNTGRLNVSYSPPALDRLKLGAALQYQSRIYFDATTSAGVAARIQQDDFALLDLLASFRVTDRVQLSANLRNVTNAKYLTGLSYDQSYYGAPRTVLGTLSVRY